ncbi:phosphoheptose isomerase [Emticicia sp. BO119]|uniref:phosphoheptose isomerase n=1 Tax=Emticicia sp. BO119 TaxID=2757768 RepID=UPI0015F0C04B|nr:phosphoheptose isomerase [Emticicia sp. BO119]MBA4850485.1 phosphoheptose isomerase [Emticicia sp. BO119]
MINLKGTDKKEVFSQVRIFIQEKGFTIANDDDSRPWGGFLVIDESQSSQFIETFFPQFSVNDFAGFEKLSPKVLLVAPNSRLSWQYHFRRSEIWTVIGGNAAIVRSETDAQTSQKNLPLGATASLKQGERHRLVGVNEWGIIAEIWQHTDAGNPSDEDDIVRVQDDFGR